MVKVRVVARRGVDCERTRENFLDFDQVVAMQV